MKTFTTYLQLVAGVLFLAGASAFAQNANGLLFDATNSNTRDQSAAFEINANTNTPGLPVYGGFLPPRVALTGTTDAATISGTEATSLLVYNTATVSDVTPGYYYWIGAPTNAWQRIISGNGVFPTGSGTPNIHAKWITASTLGNSIASDNGTNMGISSATPTAKLDVIGAATGSGLTIRAGGGGDVMLASGGSLFFDDNYSYASGNYIRPIGGANTQGFFTAGSERMRITAAGNIGIGTTGPLSILDVYRATGVGLLDDAIKVHRPGSYGQYAFMAYAQSSSDAYFGSVYTGSAGVYGQMYFRQYTQGGVFRDAMFIKTDGNVGIANTGPGYKLDVTGDTRTTGKFYGHLNVDDTRSVNTAPTGYNYEVAFDFKQLSVLNSAPGSGTYGGLMTMSPWGDNSGDASHQLLFNEGGIYWRQGQPDAATWDAWSQVLTSAPGGGGTPNYLARWITANTLGIGATYDNGTAVGIGTTTLASTLNIAGSTTPAITVTSSSYPTTYKTQLGAQSGAQGIFILGNNGVNEIRFGNTAAGGTGYIYTNNTSDFSSATTGNLSMFFKADGNVGIGNSTAPEVLSVTRTAAGWQSRFNNNSGTGADVYLSHGSGNGIHVRGWNASDAIYTLQMYNNTVETNSFWNSGKATLGLVAAANVGIGSATPGYKLDLQGTTGMRIGNSTYDANLVFGNNATWKSGIRVYDNGVAEMRIWHVNTTGKIFIGTGYNGDQSTVLPTDGMVVSANNVGIGAMTPYGKLDVTGDIFGVNNYSFQGCTESSKDWDVSGLQINPTCNAAADDSWYIQSNSSEWSRGLLSRRRFSRTPGLTLEYEAYMTPTLGGAVHYMIGFVDGNTTSYSYSQNPANLMYHDNALLSVYDNGSPQGSNYSFDTRSVWYKFKVVLKGAGADYFVFQNGAWHLVLSTANNSNKYVRVLISAYNNRMIIRNMRVYQGDLSVNNDLTGVSASASQTVAWNAGATEVSMGSYPAVYKANDNGGNGAIIIIASVTVSGNDMSFGNGVGGYQQVQALAHGVASYTLELQRRINGGGWTSLFSQSEICAIAIGDFYMQYNGITNSMPGGGAISGDIYRIPSSTSLSFFDNSTTAGNYEYRLVLTPAGSNKNGGNYLISQRSLNIMQMKR